MPLELGIMGSASCVVTDEDTAKAVGSGGVDVMSTPRLIALMENAAKDSVAPYLDLGMTCTAESTLIEIDRRRLVFEVTAHDDVEIVGKGTHERFIVNAEKFVNKCNSKKPQNV